MTSNNSLTDGDFNNQFTNLNNPVIQLPEPGAKMEEKKYYMQHFPPLVNKLYARLKLNADKLSGYKKIKTLFYDRMGYELNLDSPKSYNEKIIWKKIHDRNPLLTVTADKYSVRSYLKGLLGKQEAEKILIPVYHVTDNPGSIPFEELPEKFVVKPNHGSQMHLIVTRRNEEIKARIKEKCKEWLKINYGLYSHEWAYRNIRRKIIIEKLLQSEDGSLPRDIKLYCFHGKCRFLRASENRFGKESRAAYFDLNWNMLPVDNPGYDTIKIPIEKPCNLDKMIRLGEKLSDKFDAVRVDLYNFEGKIYFGELTHYDGSGMARFEPESFDFEMGSYWKTSKNYWKNSK